MCTRLLETIRAHACFTSCVKLLRSSPAWCEIDFLTKTHHSKKPMVQMQIFASTLLGYLMIHCLFTFISFGSLGTVAACWTAGQQVE